jgi:hypothetical protein
MEPDMEDVFNALAELGAHLGMSLMRNAQEPGREIDRTALANAIVNSAVEQASEIVGRLGVISQLNDERGDFGALVGIIARELFSLADLFTDEKVSLNDCSLDVGDTCIRAIVALRR